MPQKLGQTKSQNWNFPKVHSTFFKTALFFAHSMWVHGRCTTLIKAVIKRNVLDYFPVFCP